MLRSLACTLIPVFFLALPARAQYQAQSWPGANCVVNNDRPEAAYEYRDGRLANVESRPWLFITVSCPLPQVEAHLRPLEYRVLIHDPAHQENGCVLVDAESLDRGRFRRFEYDGARGFLRGSTPETLHFHAIVCNVFGDAEFVGYELLLER